MQLILSKKKTNKDDECKVICPEASLTLDDFPTSKMQMHGLLCSR